MIKFDHSDHFSGLESASLVTASSCVVSVLCSIIQNLCHSTPMSRNGGAEPAQAQPKVQRCAQRSPGQIVGISSDDQCIIIFIKKQTQILRFINMTVLSKTLSNHQCMEYSIIVFASV